MTYNCIGPVGLCRHVPLLFFTPTRDLATSDVAQSQEANKSSSLRPMIAAGPPPTVTVTAATGPGRRGRGRPRRSVTVEVRPGPAAGPAALTAPDRAASGPEIGQRQGAALRPVSPSTRVPAAASESRTVTA